MEPNPAPPTLCLVIPVWNDARSLAALIAQAQALGVFDQIIVVDDASARPLVVPEGVLLLYHEMRRGAGAARNTALGHITTSHVLFFDADDALTPELVALWRDLQAEPRAFDFCQFRHIDSRMQAVGHAGQLWVDEALWRLAGVAGRPLAAPERSSWPHLVQTANYPWNKIYRMAFLRAHDLRCSETMVHNDIVLHWRSFLLAERILTSDRLVARHVVARGAGRLTNRAGAERLVAYEVMAEVADLVADDPAFDLAFWQFCVGLAQWVRGVVARVHRRSADRAMARLIKKALTPERFEEMLRGDPILMRQLLALRDFGSDGVSA